MNYTATITIYELNEQFTPGKLQSQFKKTFREFPTTASFEEKRNKAYHIAVQGFNKDLIPALFFHIEIRTNDFEDKKIFEYRDYFEPNRFKRCHRKWRWDHEKKMAIGTVLFASDLN